MKKILSFLFLACFLYSCSPTRYINEQYIKNNVAPQNTNEFSSLSIKNFFTSSYGSELLIDMFIQPPAPIHYIEMSGYKYGIKKGIVIGTDLFYKQPRNFSVDNQYKRVTQFINLNDDDVKKILDNHKLLRDKVKSEKVSSFFETIYHDFTVNDKLTISFPKTKLTFKYPSFIDLWIKGEKYRCSYYSLINALENYTKY